MNGLEKILAEIKAEAEAEAAQIVSAANAGAAERLEAARAEAKAKENKIQLEAAQSIAAAERSFESAVVLERRQRILAQKRVLLAKTLEKAKETLCALPEAEYFSLLARLAAQNAQPGQGVLCLNARDKARMPAGFEAQLLAALPAGSSLTVGSETRPIDGGFVLVYGDVEENCSFAALFDARADEFNDLACGVLFA